MSKHLPPKKESKISLALKKPLIVINDTENEEAFSTKRIVILALSFFLFTAAMLIPADRPVKLVLFLIPYFITGLEVIASAIRKIRNREYLDEDFLMSVSSIAAFCIGSYKEAVVIMLFYSLGELFESYAEYKSDNALSALMDIKPQYANVESENGLTRVSPEAVLIGDTITVRPGEIIPLDGIVSEGRSSVDCSSLTGESLPKAVGAGNEVFSGTVNLTGVLKVSVTKEYKNSTVSEIFKLLKQSEANKSKHVKFIDRFSKIYTPVVVIFAIIIGTVIPFFASNWNEWIRRALIFLVVSCPCALVVSVPLAYYIGIGCAAKNGILIKGASVIDAVSKLETMVFDKTGTITEGVFSVSDIYAVNIEKSELIKIAASLEKYSNHPIANAICMAHTGELYEIASGGVNEIPGKGLISISDGSICIVGNATLFTENEIKFVPHVKAGTAVHVAVNNEYLGYILVSDKPKKGVFDTLEALRHSGISRTVMLTGDVSSNAKTLASSLNFDYVKAELLPEGKVSAVEYLEATKKSNSTLAFVGDGINDAPVIARADVGIAMGAMGSDAAMKAADIVLMDDDIRKLPYIKAFSSFVTQIVKQNIIAVLAVKFIILVLGVIGISTISLAVFGDVGVLILSLANTLRILFYKNR